MEHKILNTKHFVNVCMGLLRVTSEIIRDVTKEGIKHQMKGKDDPVTQADFRSQYVLQNGLRSFWPSLRIVGEEKDENLIPCGFDFASLSKTQGPSLFSDFDRDFDLSELVVYVDPLDGTKSFVDGSLSDVSTLIGLSYKSLPLLGIITQIWPTRNQTTQEFEFDPISYVGMVGSPQVHLVRNVSPTEFDVFRSLGQFKQQAEDSKLRVSVSINHYEPLLEKYLACMGDFEKARVSGMGHKYITVIDGQMDSFLNNQSGSGRWDTLAGSAIIEAMGGKTSNINGVQYLYDGDETTTLNTAGYFVINDKSKHEKFSEMFRKVTEEELALKSK